MALTIGTVVGSYEILSAIGAGGMGEVYKARDTRLDRVVAVKVLPDAVSADPDRVARFEREARTLATLNHTHIAQIYGVEEVPAQSGRDHARALVMEFVEGPTLAEEIENASQGPKGPGLPVDDALAIARQLADALEAAHEQGIVHRDLKPANIKVRPDGTVKVLDFGLAKAMEQAGESGTAGPQNLTQSPTLSMHATQAGIILGTAAYMSPEQARGKVVDKRADIWAFGCVLCEMLTGRRAFAGDDVGETLARVIESEPDWSLLPVALSPGIRRLLGRCLEKDPRKRLRDIGEARVQLDEPRVAEIERLTPSDSTDQQPRRRGRAFAGIAAAVCGLIIGAAGTAAVLVRSNGSNTPNIARFTIVSSGAQLGLPPGEQPFAISPSGTHIVFATATTATGGGRVEGLILRALNQLNAVPIPGTSGARNPFFSPDGQWVGFFAGGELRKVALSGGPPVSITKVNGRLRGAHWGVDGAIVYGSDDRASGLFRVSSGGGDPKPLTTPENPGAGQDHVLPLVLPNGRGVVFTQTVFNREEDFQLLVLDLRSGAIKPLLSGVGRARYVSSGRLVYAKSGTLHAVRFDPDRLEILGEPAVVAESLTGPFFDLSSDGTLVTAVGGTITSSGGSGARTLTWVDRQGGEEPVGAPARPYASRRLQLSPDGSRLVTDIDDSDGNDIWVWDFSRRTLTRLTFGDGQNWWPIWSHDGRQILFSSSGPAEKPGLARVAADGTGSVTRFNPSTQQQFPQTVTPDGRTLVFRTQTGATGPGDLHSVAIDGATPSNPLFETPFIERNAALSPDGRWLAFDSNRSGRFEVYVRPFPNVDGGQWQISGEGGAGPIWARSGRELFYVAGDATMMSVSVRTDSEFVPAVPVRLFDASPYYYVGAGPGGTYDISPDGRRFLMVKNLPATEQPDQEPRLAATTNWIAEMERRLGASR